MQSYNQLVELAKLLVTQDEAYQGRPTKAESKRIRATINEIQKLAVEAKRDLINADKE
jgi:hypothetical protein